MGFKLLSFTLPTLFETMVYTGQDKYIKHFHFNAANVLPQKNNVSFAFAYVKFKKITNALTSFIN